MWLPFQSLTLFSLPGMFFGFPYLLSYLYLFPLSEELCLINTHITKSTVCQIVEQDSVQWQVNWLKSRGVLLDVRSTLRPPGDSEALVAGGQAGGDKWACCTWGTRCESLTILADTFCEKHGNTGTLQARPCCETLPSTPHMFDQVGSVSSPLLLKQPRCSRTAL